MPEAVPGSFVCLSVSDTGAGMSPETMQHLFEPFFTTKHSGTGLGLASAYGIAKQHHGWITAYSQSGQGSTFKLYLPAGAEAAGSPSGLDSALPKSRKGRGQRILLVEDDPNVQHLARIVLQSNDYQVLAASGQAEARRLFEREQGAFDLIFSDVVLPDGNGLDLVETLAAGRSGLRVLMTSGYSDQQSRWPAIQARGWGFLQKPYPVQTLLQAIAEALAEPASPPRR